MTIKCPRMFVHVILGAGVSTLNVGSLMHGDPYDKLANVRARVGDTMRAVVLDEDSCLNISLLV